MTPPEWELMVRRDDLGSSELRPIIRRPLRAGEVGLALEKFSLSANNVTYARLGDSELPFWDAFPAPPPYGRVPVWGFARVAESRHPGIAVGSRWFGFLPMSTYHVVAADERVGRGFVDVAPHRSFLRAWYRTYQRAAEPDALDDRRALLRPVYPASFNLADFVARRVGLGVRSVIVTGASTRTAIGLVDRLAQLCPVPTVGITSAPSVEFVRRLGVYDTVLPYDEVASAPVTGPAVLVDLTGEAKRLSSVYEHFAADLVHTALVGYTHPGARLDPPPLPAPEPEIFFTPHVEEDAVAAEGEGPYYRRYHQAEQRFAESTASWLTIRRAAGPEAVAETFRALVTGSVSPDTATVLSVR